MGEPPKVPLAPEAGAAKVTVTPEIPFPLLSFTVACRAVGKVELTCAPCGVPAVALMVAGAPGLFVRLKIAGEFVPGVVAVTLYGPAIELAVKVGEMATPVAPV